MKPSSYKTNGRKAAAEMADSELIHEFLETRKQFYFDNLYRRYRTKVYSKCISMLKDENRAIDATQEIFMKIYLNLAKFDGRSKFSTWIYSITYNYCIDYLRKKKKETKLFADEPDEIPDVVAEVPDTELLEMEVGRLKKVLEAMRPDDRAILLMKYQDEMQIKEIATLLDKTESAIKMKIKRAKHKAQKIYQDIFPSDY
ncbi:MAG: RNA polymerase sigma factor [Saprospiraceae bacterium]